MSKYSKEVKEKVKPLRIDQIAKAASYIQIKAGSTSIVLIKKH